MEAYLALFKICFFFLTSLLIQNDDFHLKNQQIGAASNLCNTNIAGKVGISFIIVLPLVKFPACSKLEPSESAAVNVGCANLLPVGCLMWENIQKCNLHAP